MILSRYGNWQIPYYHLKKHRKVIEVVENFIKIGASPGHETILLLANSYVRLNKIDNSIAAYKKLLQTDANKVDVINLLGHLFLARGEIDDAMGYFKKCITLEPNNVIAAYNLAAGYVAKGKIDIATHMYINTIGKDKYNERKKHISEIRHIRDLNPQWTWPSKVLELIDQKLKGDG